MNMKHERIRWRRPPEGYKRRRGFSLGTALLGSAAIGAGGSILGSFLQSNAASNSIQSQLQMFGQGLSAQQSMYAQGLLQQKNLFGQGLTQQQSLYTQGLDQLLAMYGIGKDAQGNYVTQGLNTQAQYFGEAKNALAPVAQAGADVLPTLEKLITPGADMTTTLEQIPGFKFAQQYGQKAITNQATSRGLSSNALTAGADYATGAATQSYQGIVQQLMALYGTGAGAAGQLGQIASSTGNAGISALTGAGNAALTGATNVGGNAFSGAVNAGSAIFGGGVNAGNTIFSGGVNAGNAILSGATGVGQNIGATTVGQGQAQAAGALGVGNALQGGASSLTNLALLQALSGKNISSAGLFGNSSATGTSNAILGG